jgi:anion-transporting  ArsA/GET3 family ATPase
MADFFSSRLLRWLTVPYRSRIVNVATRPFYRVADTILGSAFLEDIAEFFLLFQTMYAGFVERARAVQRVLEDKRTTFVVVSTLESAPLREAEFFMSALDERRFHLGAVVLNKVLPSYLLDAEAAGAASRIAVDPAPAAAALDGLGDPDAVARVIEEVAQSFLNYRVVASREAEQRAELGRTPDVLATVPYFASDIHDLAGLIRLGQQIWR